MLNRARRRVPRDQAELDEWLRQAGFTGEEAVEDDVPWWEVPGVTEAMGAAIKAVSDGTEGRCLPGQ